jgi:hypothetical protein
MANEHCLAGMACPNCGSEGPFRITVLTTVLMYDEGSEYDKMGSDLEYDETAYCECYECHHPGTVEGFTLPEQPRLL